MYFMVVDAKQPFDLFDGMAWLATYFQVVKLASTHDYAIDEVAPTYSMPVPATSPVLVMNFEEP